MSICLSITLLRNITQMNVTITPKMKGRKELDGRLEGMLFLYSILLQSTVYSESLIPVL